MWKVPLDGVYTLPRMVDKPPFTVPVPGVEAVQGETIPRRHPGAIPDFIHVPEEGCNTLYDVMLRSARKYPDAKAVGRRKFIKNHTDIKKVKKVIDGKEELVDKEWVFAELGAYEFITYSEFAELCLELGAGLVNLGFSRDDKLLIYAGTGPHWFAMAHGAGTQSITFATVYETLGPEGLRDCLKKTASKLIFVDPQQLKILLEPLDGVETLQYIVYDNARDPLQEDIVKLKKAYPQLTILNIDELRQTGRDNPVASAPPSKEDVCCIMYTSGTFGDPKGVCIKHRMIVGTISGGNSSVHYILDRNDIYIAYLPLAHIIEFAIENACFYMGTALGYASPRTLTDAMVRNCKGDLTELRPTAMAGVPVVWENIRKGISAKVNSSSAFVRTLFWGALYLKTFLVARGLPGVAFLDKAIFSKVREATGGRIRLTFTGGAPIASETQNFISMVIAELLGGYGLTETTGMCSFCDPLQWTTTAIGGLPPTVEIKLVDYEEAGYFAKNNQGEVWIRGPAVFDEYFEDEVNTKEARTEDGWFKTGDIGEWDENFHIRLIDRKKNLAKMSNGKYIAIERLESRYRSAAIVANVCVHADSLKDKPIAIVVPAEPALMTLATANGISGDLAHLVRDPKIKQLVLAELQAKGRAGGLHGTEIIDAVILSDEEWTLENGLVTPSQKIKRRAIFEKFKSEIETL